MHGFRDSDAEIVDGCMVSEVPDIHEATKPRSSKSREARDVNLNIDIQGAIDRRVALGAALEDAPD